MNSIIIAWMMVRRTIGKPKGVLLYIILPVIVISVIIGLFHPEPSIKQVILLNNDKGELGQQLSASLGGLEGIELAAGADLTAEQLRALVESGKADAGIIVPEDYTASLYARQAEPLQLLRAKEELWNVSLAVKLEAQDGMLRKLAAAAAAQGSAERDATVRGWLEEIQGSGIGYVKEQSGQVLDVTIMVIGMMLLFVMLLANQSILTVVQDREQRTMQRMFTAPVGAGEIALGNFLGSVLLGTMQQVLILLTTRYLLGFDIGVSLPRMLLVMECFLLSAVGIATAVAAVVKNISNFGYVNNLVVSPTCILGGCFWPVALMPEFMQKLSGFTPQRWAIIALEESIRGATVYELALPLGILLLFAFVLLGFGATVLQPAREASR